LVWHIVNGVRNINEVMLHRAGLVLRLVTTFCWYAIPVFTTQPGHPYVLGGAVSTGDGFGDL